jgi:hypothetical protein
MRTKTGSNGERCCESTEGSLWKFEAFDPIGCSCKLCLEDFCSLRQPLAHMAAASEGGKHTPHTEQIDCPSDAGQTADRLAT